MKKQSTGNESVNDEQKVSSQMDAEMEGAAERDNVTDDASSETDTMADEKQEEVSKEEALATELAHTKDSLLRLQAEFDNYRKRTLKEKMELVQTGGRDVLLAMLPVMDDIQRAVGAMEKSDDVEALRSGVQLIKQKFSDVLRQRGVTEIEVVGKDFNEELSEAVARFQAGEEQKGKVIDAVQAGYMLGDKVLRFAKVVVGE